MVPQTGIGRLCGCTVCSYIPHCQMPKPPTCACSYLISAMPKETGRQGRMLHRHRLVHVACSSITIGIAPILKTIEFCTCTSRVCACPCPSCFSCSWGSARGFCRMFPVCFPQPAITHPDLVPVVQLRVNSKAGHDHTRAARPHSKPGEAHTGALQEAVLTDCAQATGSTPCNMVSAC